MKLKLRQFLSMLLAAAPPVIHFPKHRRKVFTKLESPHGAVMSASNGKVMVRATVAPPPKPMAVLPGFRITSVVVDHQITISWVGETGPFVLWQEDEINGIWAMANVAPTFDSQFVMPCTKPREFFKVQPRAYAMFAQTDPNVQPRIAWTLPSLQ